jgi:hypothetical protein
MIYFIYLTYHCPMKVGGFLCLKSFIRGEYQPTLPRYLRFMLPGVLIGFITAVIPTAFFIPFFTFVAPITFLSEGLR